MKRWFIVEIQTGNPHPRQPMDGFATREEAVDFHQTILGSDHRYEVSAIEG